MFKSRDMMSNMRFSGLYHNLNREFKRRHESANLEKCIFNWTDKSLKEFCLSCLFSLCTVDTSSEQPIIGQKLLLLFTDIKSNGRNFISIALLTFECINNIISMSGWADHFWWNGWLTSFSVLLHPLSLVNIIPYPTKIYQIHGVSPGPMQYLTVWWRWRVFWCSCWWKYEGGGDPGPGACPSNPCWPPLVLCAHCYCGDM